MLNNFPGLSVNLLLAISLLFLLRNLSNQNNLLRALFAGLAIFINLRYFSWRLHATMDPFLSSIESIWHWAFFLAEFIAILSLSWHLFVLAWKPRKPKPLPLEPVKVNEQLPRVDVFIATYNEGKEMVENTIIAAKQIDYDNYQVYVLDDGNRDWLKACCEEHSVNYIRRETHLHFKAGNLNHALTKAKGDYILCLDADFTAKPKIIKQMLGYFADASIAIVQSPQHFRNTDAIQHNLHGQHAWPEEQLIFTDIMQPCRDNWDNAFCYGTNFIVRRKALDSIGGFPTDSICEDLLLSYTLKRKGWITRYHNESLAEGEASNTLTEFVSQRTRWCAGTMQCLFLKNGPIRSAGLSIMDRLFFLDTIAYYLSAVWFFFILIAPAIFWWTGHAPFSADNGHLLMMLAPRVLTSMIVIYWLTDRKVIPVISELGRYVGIYHILKACITTILSPKSPSFRVTAKNNLRDRTSFNWVIARPHLIMLGITIAGIIRTSLFGMISDNGLNQNIGLILALTIFSFWIGFFALLICIEPPIHQTSESKLRMTSVGSVKRSLSALVLKIVK